MFRTCIVAGCSTLSSRLTKMLSKNAGDVWIYEECCLINTKHFTNSDARRLASSQTHCIHRIPTAQLNKRIWRRASMGCPMYSQFSWHTQVSTLSIYLVDEVDIHHITSRLVPSSDKLAFIGRTLPSQLREVGISRRPNAELVERI